jgi:hypothetical protein
MDGRPSRESWRQPCCRVQRPGVIWMILKLGMGIQVLRPSVDVVKGAADLPIRLVVAIEAADEEAVDYPREVVALAKGAVNTESTWAASAGWGVEGDGLAVAEPHREVSDRRFLLFQPRCKIPAAREECISFVDQIARGCFGEGLLLWRFPSGLVHQRRQLPDWGVVEAINR